ncbi:type VI secretion system-associated protein TagF [Oceaniglobus roseus]|uniref:type VI secretion system-associated protein TagF n=1 Tax=Oceaniglobus roseus TaxID=1737570 RepID=UPI000C7F3F8A|nr:type VI secretion system-associated protein TagF [Kandeliimicrobium roseum]
MAGFGAFGKIPATGDFIRYGLAQPFLLAWDRWLQEAMSQARGQLGGGWQDCYFAAPIWRFTLSSGQAGQTGMIGVMMPSLDRVGRQFPLTLAAPLLSPQPVAQLHFEARHTFEQLEAIALAVLDDMPLERLRQQLASLRPVEPCTRIRIRSVAAARSLVARMDSGDDPVGLCGARTLTASFRAPGVWSAHLAQDTRLLVCEGLPRGEEITGLFNSDAPIWQAGAVA